MSGLYCHPHNGYHHPFYCTCLGLSSTEKLDRLEYMLRDLKMIRHDLAKIVGTRDSLVKQLDTLMCGVETELDVRQEAQDERSN